MKTDRAVSPRVHVPEVPSRAMPFAVAGGLVVLGGLLLRSRPDLLDLPDPRVSRPAPTSRGQAVARRSRDAVAALVPDNLSKTLGRSLVITGVALLTARALDLFAGE